MKKSFPIYLLSGILTITSHCLEAQTDPTCDTRQIVRLGNDIGNINTARCIPGVYIGYGIGASNTITSEAKFNTIVGLFAGSNITSGSSNVMMGTFAGSSLTSGSANFFLGDNAGGRNTTGGFNVYLGANAGNGPSVNGNGNIAIGFESGRKNANGVTNLFLGFQADAGSENLVNATAIGPNARVDVSNAIVLGNQASVGIGTNAPTTRLHITSGTSKGSGLRLENLTSSSNANMSTNKFLTVDGLGNVILAYTASGARVAATDNSAVFWERKNGHLQSTKEDALVIGSGINALPSGYRLYVQDGILTEKVKIAVKNTADWSDKVFEKGYQLKSLVEVEQYIKQTGHLPGVPSANEIVDKGIDIAKMDAKLLEKIEELTLYSIQLEKESQQQNTANRRLQESEKKQQLINKQQQAEIDELKQLVKQLLDRK